MISFILNKIKLYKMQRYWRKKNQHNTTFAVNMFNSDLVKVGKATYGGVKVLSFNAEQKLFIGNYCSIGPEVVFILSADHPLNYISTFPFRVKCLQNSECEGISKGDIILEDDVWIGYGAIILSGVHIGQGAVIGAGAVVTANVPPYAIVAGNPAKVVRYRFREELLKVLRRVDYSEIGLNYIKENEDRLYQPLEQVEQLDDIPLKSK